ncbi:MAG: hypothetical protein RR620_03550 [Clostridium sp.]
MNISNLTLYPTGTSMARTLVLTRLGLALLDCKNKSESIVIIFIGKLYPTMSHVISPSK